MVLQQIGRWDGWERLVSQRRPVDLLSDCADETLLDLLACHEGGDPEARELIATELAYRLGILREIAQLQADRTLDASSRGEQESVLTAAEIENAHAILNASRALLDNRRAEGNVGSRLRVHLGNLTAAVGRAQAHLIRVRGFETKLRADSQAVVRKMDRHSRRQPGNFTHMNEPLVLPDEPVKKG